MRPPVRSLLSNAYSMRCPRCHDGKLFAGVFRMPRECAICGLPYFREPGYYMGAMILNYGVTAGIVLFLYLLSLFFPDQPGLSANLRIILWMAFAISLRYFSCVLVTVFGFLMITGSSRGVRDPLQDRFGCMKTKNK